MMKARTIALTTLCVILAVSLSASTAYAAQPAWGVRLGAQMFWEATGTYGSVSGHPEFSGGTVYWSREVPTPYPFDLDHLVREVFYRGFLTDNHLAVLEWRRGEQYGGGGSVWYLDPADNGAMTSEELVGTAWDVGTWRLGIICKPGTLDEGWAYIDHIRCGLDAQVYFDIPDWAPIPTPVPEPPEIPDPEDPGTVPPITYPTLPDGGSTPPPGGLPQPGDGDISPLPDTPLDPIPDPEDLDPVPDPDELPGPADPVPVTDDPPGPEDLDPIPAPDDPLPADPIPDADDPLTADPLPEADDPLTPDPLPDADDPITPDPLPDADDPLAPDPLPTPDDIPDLDQIPGVDPLPEVDPITEPDPLPGGP